jgi:hypothetical protein
VGDENKEVKPGMEGHPAAEPPKETPATPPAATGATVFKSIDGREFKTPDELAQYAKSIEEKYISSAVKAPPAAPPAAPAAPAAGSKDPELAEIENMLFIDPAKALEKHSDYIMRKVEGREQSKAATQQFWDKFYQENPDLKAAERVVGLVAKERHAELANLDLVSASKKIAEEARKVIQPIQGNGGKVTEVENRETTQFGGSGARAPKADGKPPEAPESFCDQVRRFKSRGNKA